MSQAEYARHRAKSRQYISRLAKAGVLVMRGGKVDVAASDAVLDDRPEPVSERVAATPVETAPTGMTFAQAKTADMVFKARLRKMEYDQRMGALLPAAEVRQIWAAGLAKIRDRVLSLPDRLAARLAQHQEVEVRAILRDALEECLRGIHADAAL
ncbi:MAG: hypothetical protein ACUVT2_08170 [Thiobacillaceae bacterium]